MAKYYIYIDDSGKFHKPGDIFVNYSYIVFNKEQRKKFEEEYVKLWPLICNSKNNYSKKEISDISEIYKFGGKVKKGELLGGILKEEPKGKSLIPMYNDAIKYLNKPFSEKIEEFFGVYSIATYIGTLFWCKECSSEEEKKSWNNDEKTKERKKMMISLILKNLFDIGVLRGDDDVSIYIDHEFNEYNDEMLSIDFKDYLNRPISPFHNLSEVLKVLRKNNINCVDFHFLDSWDSIPIRCADLIANLMYKKWNRNPESLTPTTTPHNVFNYLQNKNKINWLIYPSFECNIDKENGSHNHLKERNTQVVVERTTGKKRDVEF